MPSSRQSTYSGTSWNAAGPVQIGRRLYQGTYGEYANGNVSDVHVYDTALPPTDAAAKGDNPGVSHSADPQRAFRRSLKHLLSERLALKGCQIA